jgi:glycosyltransferase involved in cell wall biosynthesis
MSSVDMPTPREEALEHRTQELQGELDALHRTLSWRITAPLRRLRGLLRHARTGPGEHERASPAVAGELLPDSGCEAETCQGARASRLDVVAGLLGRPAPEGSEPHLAAALARVITAVQVGHHSTPLVAWLVWTATEARYPTEAELDEMALMLELDGPEVLAGWVSARAASPPRALSVVDGGVVVDASTTAASEVHSGIQRVVRETVQRWMLRHDPVLIGWSPDSSTPVELDAATRSRLATAPGWTDPLTLTSGSSTAVVVPWRSVVIVPETITDPDRSDRYRALARVGVARRLSAIAFDLTPITMRETFPNQMADSFPGYLGVLKYADRISAISDSTARELAGFADMLSAQGRSGAEVRVHTLPVEPLATSEHELATTADLLGLRDKPLVLVVGSHEPRKNHVVVLLAAERLWRSGLSFDLVFLGASAWRTESFEQLTDRLQRAGRPVRVLRRVPEPTLWAAYRLATVTVFPSLAEGFGLPVAESLACGTPVITSGFGSMAELAAGGGVIEVDPRDAASVQAALALLLSDRPRLEALRGEALRRRWPSWDSYAAETWHYLAAP